MLMRPGIGRSLAGVDRADVSLNIVFGWNFVCFPIDEPLGDRRLAYGPAWLPSDCWPIDARTGERWFTIGPDVDVNLRPSILALITMKNVFVARFLPRAPIGTFLHVFNGGFGRKLIVTFGGFCEPLSKCRSRATLRTTFTFGKREIPESLIFFPKLRTAGTWSKRGIQIYESWYQISIVNYNIT